MGDQCLEWRRFAGSISEVGEMGVSSTNGWTSRTITNEADRASYSGSAWSDLSMFPDEVVLQKSIKLQS